MGGLFVIGAITGIAWLHHDATDFPTEDPIHVVDAELVARLRAQPGLHLALARDHRLDVELDLREDPLNRLVYGTDVDLREARSERAIHVQLKGRRGAIHADGNNPKAGLVPWLVHATVDVPFTPLLALLFVGVYLSVGAAARAGGRAARCEPRGDPQLPPA